MPTKRLPPKADITHLRHQAKDLLHGFRACDLGAYQRIREFHPKRARLQDAEIANGSFTLSDAQLTIAREYGYTSWPRLREVIAKEQGAPVQLIHNERISDHAFAQALDFIDEGDAVRLTAHLAAHPELIQQRVTFEGDNYFTNPTLIEFIAENPVRQDRMPQNVVEIAQVLLDAGAKSNVPALEETLMLVASGRVAREAGAQVALINLLCAQGAAPDKAMAAALGHGEFDAARALISQGAQVNLPAASALGDMEAATGLMAKATTEQRQLALSWAALHGHAKIVAVLLHAGADPNRYNAPGGDSHCTPLHSAALAGHLDVVQTLIDGGARQDIGDVHHQATAAGWAAHGGHTDIVALLKAAE